MCLKPFESLARGIDKNPERPGQPDSDDLVRPLPVQGWVGETETWSRLRGWVMKNVLSFTTGLLLTKMAGSLAKPLCTNILAEHSVAVATMSGLLLSPHKNTEKSHRAANHREKSQCNSEVAAKVFSAWSLPLCVWIIRTDIISFSKSLLPGGHDT